MPIRNRGVPCSGFRLRRLLCIKIDDMKKFIVDSTINKTIYDLMKTINISTLKSKASSTFKEVRKGASFIVVSHDIPIAEIIPYKNTGIIIKNPTRKFKISKSNLKIKIDPVKYLLEDRDSR